MAKGKDHHVFLNPLEGDDNNDGTEGLPVRSVDRAKMVMMQRGSSKCTGIRVLGVKVSESPCGAPQCGACTKANGRRLCPGQGCDRWISVSAKQHECGWRKPEVEKRPPIKEFHHRPDDHHGFERLKRKMMDLAQVAAMQFGWDGVIMGYAPKVGRGGSTARITFASPQNELYYTDERGSIKVKPGLDERLSVNADNAVALIRQRMCPSERLAKAELPHAETELPHHMTVQGAELAGGMEDKHAHEALPGDVHAWMAQRAEMAELEKSGAAGAGPLAHAGLVQGHLPPAAMPHAQFMELQMQMQMDAMHKRARPDEQ